MPVVTPKHYPPVVVLEEGTGFIGLRGEGLHRPAFWAGLVCQLRDGGMD